MYLLAYYLGSSAFGALVGLGYQAWGWPGVAGSVATLFGLGVVAGALEPREAAASAAA